jgi:hypothetical protein
VGSAQQQAVGWIQPLAEGGLTPGYDVAACRAAVSDNLQNAQRCLYARSNARRNTSWAMPRLLMRPQTAAEPCGLRTSCSASSSGVSPSPANANGLGSSCHEYAQTLSYPSSYSSTSHAINPSPGLPCWLTTRIVSGGSLSSRQWSWTTARTSRMGLGWMPRCCASCAYVIFVCASAVSVITGQARKALSAPNLLPASPTSRRAMPRRRQAVQHQRVVRQRLVQVDQRALGHPGLGEHRLVRHPRGHRLDRVALARQGQALHRDVHRVVQQPRRVREVQQRQGSAPRPSQPPVHTQVLHHARNVLLMGHARGH